MDGARTPFAGGASAEELLARALEVIEQQSVRIDELARQNAELREQNAQLAGASEELRELVGGQAAQLAEANATMLEQTLDKGQIGALIGLFDDGIEIADRLVSVDEENETKLRQL